MLRAILINHMYRFDVSRLNDLKQSLSDTEIAEDVIQDVLRVNLARNASEVMQRLPHITGHKVAGNAILQS